MSLYEILVIDDPVERLPAFDPDRLEYLDRLSGSRAKRLHEKALALPHLDGERTRNELILTSLTEFYITQGLKRFQKVDAGLQRDVLAWVDAMGQVQDNEVHEFRFLHRRLKSSIYQGVHSPIRMINLGYVEEYFCAFENSVMTEVYLKALYSLRETSCGHSRQLYVETVPFVPAKEFSMCDALKACLGHVSARDWGLDG
ncbi:hypothetical protein ACYPKM_04170 [Pseudomonas aeruginosa]